MLYTFGKIVEEEEGAGAVWLTYIVCALGASIASFFFDQGAVSLGASGAVFGLFAVAVLLKLKFSFQKLVEGLVLGQFVVKQVLQEVKSAQAGGLAIAGAKVGHVAHLGGALMGVLLILALSRLPEVSPKKKLP
ncbi:hypothetical protein CVIRNUC_008016 [Coccomyxa viridis]|uniref:Peptidase S54 rhomboid domain-containing protein n=1 Tax=Coccomyxa viridis TaxID=1274662 RepID=A0AAV1IF60_9CHLO|nr:hypothetical protein CVIRNUC_008016 [Coccomyxa viridis]